MDRISETEIADAVIVDTGPGESGVCGDGTCGGGAAPWSCREIVRPVEIIKGVRAIAAFLGISQSEVLKLEGEGAPMRRRNGIIRAEKAELWEWWKNSP